MNYQMKPPPGTLPNDGHHLCPTSGLWLMETGGGKIVQDLSGNGNTGTFGADARTPTWSSGESGPAVLFDATDNILIGHDIGISTPPFSIVVRCRPISFADVRTLLCGSDSAYPQFRINNDGDLRLNSYQVGPIVTGDTPCTAGAWVTAACTYDGNTGEIYKDGVLDGSAVSARVFTSRNTVIAAGGIGVEEFYGTIEWIYVYGRVLTASEMAQLHHNPFCMFDYDPIELWSAATLGAALEGNAGIMTTNTGFWGATF